MDGRFMRNEMLWGREGQLRLSRAHVIVFGLGGVGSYAAECLARAGVGELTLVDSDTVSISNINRQLEALTSTVGLPKAEAVATRLADIDPSARLHPMVALYDAAHRDQFFPDGCRYDYIVDAIDLVSCKLDLAETARRLGIPLIMALGTGNKLDLTALRARRFFQWMDALCETRCSGAGRGSCGSPAPTSSSLVWAASAAMLRSAWPGPEWES